MRIFSGRTEISSLANRVVALDADPHSLAELHHRAVAVATRDVDARLFEVPMKSATNAVSGRS